jgi:GT2 family glycosyltransferase
VTPAPGRRGAEDADRDSGPGVSVVVASRQRRERLVASLDRLAESGAGEIIVVDNGSTDGTADAVRRSHPTIRLIELPANRGAAGRTLGVRAARHPVVAFADDDSWWAPGALRRASTHFAAHPHLAVLAARVLVGTDERLDPASGAMSASPLPATRPLPGPRVLGFVACGALVRRSAFLSIGGFSDLLFFMGEERLVALDLAAAGWDLAYAPDVVAHHHPAAGGPDRRALVARNDLLTVWLRRPWAQVVGASAGLAARAPRDPVARRALAGALARAPRALTERRRLPAAVEADVRVLERAGQPVPRS